MQFNAFQHSMTFYGALWSCEVQWTLWGAVETVGCSGHCAVQWTLWGAVPSDAVLTLRCKKNSAVVFFAITKSASPQYTVFEYCSGIQFSAESSAERCSTLGCSAVQCLV